MNEDDFHKTIHGKKVKFLTITKKRTQNEQILIEKLKDAMGKEDLENSSSYFHVNELNNIFSENDFNDTNFFHMNVSSICRNFDDLETLLAKINVKFNVIGIIEARLKKSSIRNTNVDLNGYSFKHTPTEANCGGALLYIDNNINYIVRDDLCIYRSKELESVFIKIINSKGKNTIEGCVYRHPCMNPTEFVDIYLSELLQKFSKEDKTIMLMGDFNIDLLKQDHNTESASFLDSLYTNFLLPYISTPS